MKYTIFSLFLLAILGTSCNKEENPTPVASDNYMSNTATNSWSYELIDNIATSTTLYTVTSTSKDSVINSKTYHVFTNSTNSNEYYNISGNDYFQFRSLPATFGGSNVEINYLKDNGNVGTSWNQVFTATISGFLTNVTLTNTIAEKGGSKVVNGNTYNNVIKVTSTFAVTISGIPLPAAALTTDIQNYYAPKYGLIQSINKININFSGIDDRTDQQINLKSASLK